MLGSFFLVSAHPLVLIFKWAVGVPAVNVGTCGLMSDAIVSECKSADSNCCPWTGTGSTAARMFSMFAVCLLLLDSCSKRCERLSPRYVELVHFVIVLSRCPLHRSRLAGMAQVVANRTQWPLVHVEHILPLPSAHKAIRTPAVGCVDVQKGGPSTS